MVKAEREHMYKTTDQFISSDNQRRYAYQVLKKEKMVNQVQEEAMARIERKAREQAQLDSKKEAEMKAHISKDD